MAKAAVADMAKAAVQIKVLQRNMAVHKKVVHMELLALNPVVLSQLQLQTLLVQHLLPAAPSQHLALLALIQIQFQTLVQVLI